VGLLLAILAVTGLTGREAQAAFPGANGKIAFNSDRDGNLEIYAMEPDGSGRVRLTNNAATDTFPAWSPDGQRIAFQSFRDGHSQIYVMNADGSGQVNLSNNVASDAQPVWSPDGQRIAFTSGRDGNAEVYVMNADGSGQSNLTHNAAPDVQPAWSPDVQRIAFTSIRDGHLQIYVMNADGSGQVNLSNNAADDLEPSWSPDGRRIAFFSFRDSPTGQIYVMNADGSGQVNLSNNAAFDEGPAWSPDGQRIAFTSSRDGNGEIYVMNADGSGQLRRTTDPGVDDEADWQPIIAGGGVCSRVGTLLNILMPANSSVKVGLNGTNFAVTVNNIPDPGCSSATVNNVDTVDIRGSSPGADTLTLDLSTGQFAPGATPEGSGISEIEFQLDLLAGNDELIIQGGTGVEKITLGSGGINVNGDNDADLTPTSVEHVTVNGGDGNDQLSGKGGVGTGAAFGIPLLLNGDTGNDKLTDGLAADVVKGGPGNDSMNVPKTIDAGDDYAGGPGTDTLSYAPRKQAVHVSTDDQPNDGSIEGDNARSDIEKLTGGNGNDVLRAVTQAKETVRGGAGDDALDVLDGNPGDIADGGAGAGDSCIADPGDTKLNCET
jgi:TolB protein